MLYQGQCVTTCPDGYFVTWTPNKTVSSKSNMFDSDSLSLIRFKPWTSSGSNQLLSKEPTASSIKAAGSSGLSCSKCHYSCRTCVSSSNCTLCYPDSTLHKSSGHCYPTSLVTEVIELERWYSAISVTFLCLCLVILFLVIYIITDKNPGIILSCCPSGSASNLDHQRNRRSVSMSMKREATMVNSNGLCFGTSTSSSGHGRINPLASTSSMSPLNNQISNPEDSMISTKVYCDSEDDL